MAKKRRIPKHEEMSFNRSLLLNPNSVGIPVNRASWSENSQRSWSLMDVYTDDTYRCRYCGDKAVFTAKEQKYAYEVQKRHIHQKRVLCQACFHDMHEKRDAIDAIQLRWRVEKNTLQNDVIFLREWREKLIDFQHYTQKSNNTICSLQKRIEKLEGNYEY